MGKREKILIGLMGIAVLYALYVFFIEPAPQSGPDTQQSSSGPSGELVTKMVEDLKSGDLTQTETYILSKTQEEWERDPFLEKPLPVQTEAANVADAPQLSVVYSGYVLAGNKVLGLINGMEYQVGEELESGGYVVVEIDPEKVVLQARGKGGRITVPFTE